MPAHASLCPGTGTHVRSAATVGGNLALAVRARPLESDLVTVLIGARARVQVSNADGSRRATSCHAPTLKPQTSLISTANQAA